MEKIRKYIEQFIETVEINDDYDMTVMEVIAAREKILKGSFEPYVTLLHTATPKATMRRWLN